MIRVQLNDAIHVDVDTDDQQKALEHARNYFAQNHAEAWNQRLAARPLPGPVDSAVSGFRGGFGTMVQGAAPVAELLGARETAASIRGAGEAISGPDDFATRSPELRDLRERPLALGGTLLGSALGSIASFLATGLGAGAAIRAGLGAVGVGAGLGASVAGAGVAAGAALGAGEMEQLLRAEGVDPTRAAALSVTLGPLIGVAEQGALLGALRRALGREVSAATAQAIAGRGLLRPTLRTAAAEGALEAGGEAARQGLAAAETGNLNLEQRATPVIFGALGGALGGGAFGAPAAMMERGAARRELAANAPPPPPPAAPPPEPTPWLPAEPAPFTDRAEAEAFIEANRAARPGVNLPTDEALLAHVNTLRRNAWEQETSDLRAEAIRQALGGPPTAELNASLSPQSSVGQQIEARIARGESLEPGTGRVMRPGAQTVEEQAEIVLPTLLELGQQGTINLQAIQPQQVAEHILGTIDAAEPTDAEVALVDRTLQGLRRAKYLTAGAEPGTYTLAQRRTGRPSQSFQPLEQPGTVDQQAAQAFLDLVRAYIEVEQTDPQRKRTAGQAGTQGTRALSVDEIKERTRLIDQGSPKLLEQITTYLQTEDPTERARVGQALEGYVVPAVIAPPATLPEGGNNLEAKAPTVGVTSPTQGSIGAWEATADPEVVAAVKGAAIERTQQAREGGTYNDAGVFTPDTSGAARKAFFDGLLTPDGQRLLQQMVAGEKGTVTSNRFQQLFAGQGQPISKEMAVAAYQAARQGGVLNRLGAVNPNFKVAAPEAKKPSAVPKEAPKKPLVVPKDEPKKKPLTVPKPTATERLAKIKEEKKKEPTERVRGFVTEDGTTYELNNDGSTVREGKDRSSRTIYVSTEDAKQFKMPTKDGRLVVKKDKISLLVKDGKNFKILAKDVPFNDAPDRKLVPIALNKGTKYELGTVYSEATFGNPIVDTISFAEVPTQQGQRTQQEVNEAVQDFYKMVGTSGRLEFAQRLLIEDLDSEVQAAAAAAGITWNISGYAQGDLAVLSLGNSSMPLNQVAIHEGWHIAENIGLATPMEVDLLNANLERIRDTIRPIAQKWGLNVDSLPPQEVRAYGYNARVLERADFGFLNSVFDKFKAFLGRIRNFMKGRGFTDWRDAYDSFAGGERASFENAQHIGFPINFNALMEDATKRAKVTDTPEFKNWFGNSQVVDGKGRPKIVYHGTGARQTINVFNTRTHGHLGAHFGSIQAASQFVQPSVEWTSADPEDSYPLTVYPVYIKIENPLRLDDNSGHWAHWEVTPQLELKVTNGEISDPDGVIGKAKAEMDKIPNHQTHKSEPILQKLIQDLGFDGVVYANDVEDNGRDSYIVFRPEQIKSAVGNSTFNPADQRIHFAAPTLPTNTAAAHKIVKDHLHGNFGRGVLRYFASPTLTMGKVARELQPAADVQKTIHTRSNEFANETEELLASVAHISDAERAEVTKLLDKANQTQKQSNISGLSAAAQQAYKDVQATFQRAFDYAIESLVIEHYRQEGKSPADAAKLDKLWARHAGKHLWEIPKAELRAASAAGWKAIEELEKQRNPFFLPQVADGTHFVAAYKKDAQGNKIGAPLRMYAYTPNTVMQRMRGQANPVEALKAELAKEFDPAKHYIMQDGQQFTRDQEANAIRGSADFISQYLNELKENKSVISNKAAQEIIGRMSRQLDKLSVSRVFKPNQDILRAVSDKNASRYLLEQGPQYLLGLSKVQARWFTESTWTRALEGVGPNDKNFLNDLRDYSTTPTEAFGGLRTMMFFTYLGGALDTATLNGLQMLQTTMPMITRDGGNPAAVLKAAGELMKKGVVASAFSQKAGQFVHRVSDVGKDADEKAALERAGKLGAFNSNFTNESRGQFVGAHFAKLGVANPGAWADGANRIARYAGTLMQAVEQFNRATTFLAAYREAKAKPEMILRNNRLSNKSLAPTDAFGYAMNMVDSTQFLTTKEDRAFIQRFTPAAEVATQFLSFPLKMFELWLGNGYDMLKGIAKTDLPLAKAGAVGFMGMAAPIVALAGIWALPGADFTKELLERLTELWTGEGTQNFDADMRRLLGAGFGTDALLRGLPHAGGTVSLSRRLAIDPLPFNDLMSMGIMTFTGPAGSYAESVLRNMPQYYANQDYFNMAAALLPRAVGNVVRAGGIAANEEVYSLRGNRVISPQMVADAEGIAGIPAWFRVAIGFQPPAFVNARELLTRAEEVDRQMRAPTERFNKNAARHMLRMMEAGQTGDAERSAREAQALQELIQKAVARNVAEPDPSRWININMQAVQRRALNDLMGRGSPESVLREASPRNRAAMQEEINLR